MELKRIGMVILCVALYFAVIVLDGMARGWQ